jgi:hypothetical protein
MLRTPAPRAPRRFAAAVAAALAVTAALPVAGGAAQEAPAATARPGLVEVARVPVPKDSTPNSAWLVLNPTTRRGYHIAETLISTIIESFDLDTLKPRRRLELAGIPIPTGRRDGFIGPAGTARSGEIVHAFDEEAGILYLPLGNAGDPVNLAGTEVSQRSLSADARRLVSRWVAIDERALDEGREAVASFRLPEAHAHLRTYWLHGLEVDRHRTSADPTGRQVGGLIQLFAQPNNPQAPLHAHELVRWDVSRVLAPSAAARTALGTAADSPAAATRAEDGRRVLDACQLAPLTPGQGYPASGAGLHWEMLVGEDDVVLACQSAPASGAVARLALEADGGLPTTGGMTVFPLGRPAYDAILDRGAGRVFLRTTGDDGETWWVFDPRTRRYTGSLAAKVASTGSMTAGVDRASGRLYSFTPDYIGTFGGREAPVRGGLAFADTRLFTPVPFENARPDLSYPAGFRIPVDPVRRHVFLRRGHHAESAACWVYPSTQATSKCPVEPFYRVLKDTIPIPREQPEADDAAFTTDVPERDGVTQASFLGTASGYGVRAVFLGGLGALGAPPACGVDDRDVLSGSVGKVEVSDISTAAEASSLDADLSTQKVAATPARSCIPGGSSPADHDELSFDKRDNDDPAVKAPDGVNDYEASCTGDGTDKPPTVDGRVPRHGFSSEVTCDRRGERAEGKATGELSLPDGALGVRVARGHSEARIVRKQGEGIKAVVDSWARGIVIPNVGEIGAVRGEATVEAAGRVGSARTSFERTVCDVDFGDFQHLGCLDLEKDAVVDRLNEAATGKAEFRLRQPDPAMERGSRSGYRAAVQRDRLDGFGDRVLARDNSLAVPTLEVVLYDAGRRRTFHLAGVQAAVSYGIACLEGQGRDGKCADGLDEGDLSDELPADDDDDIAAFDDDSGSGTDDVAFVDGTAEALGPFGPSKGESAVTRFLRAPVRAAAAALRLLFNNPRELGLMTAVWLLLYGPFRLAGRHRSVRALRRRRLAPT